MPFGAQSEFRPAALEIASPGADVKGCQVWSLCDVEVSGLADARDAVNRLKECHCIYNKLALRSIDLLP